MDVLVDPNARRAARGQAVIEALMALALLGVMFTAQQWLGTLQEEGLALGVLGRHDAFVAAQSARINAPSVVSRTCLRGGLARPAGLGESGCDPVTSHLVATGRADVFEQSGGPAVEDLRRDWRLAETGVVRATVSSSLPRLPAWLSRQSARDRSTVHRHTDILRDDGHSSSAAESVGRLARSHRAWRGAFLSSQRVARRVSSRVAGQDRAWHRSAVTRDWLTPWAKLALDDVRSRP